MAEWLNEAEVASVLEKAKWIEEDVEWRRRPGYQEFSVEVRSESVGHAMVLKGVITEATGYFKLHLFAGSQPIVMLHAGKVHHNPDCEKLHERIHKHVWTDAYREKRAYVPTELTVSDWASVFHGFLRECNIGFRGRFVAPAIQRRLW
ncbi:MAG TPA: hypothetical protein VNJ11_11070 [Bryobacteraceae bacterium]|nr:hypothetical protein [Bryobacteraceae bacterium]